MALEDFAGAAHELGEALGSVPFGSTGAGSTHGGLVQMVATSLTGPRKAVLWTTKRALCSKIQPVIKMMGGKWQRWWLDARIHRCERQ